MALTPECYVTKTPSRLRDTLSLRNKNNLNYSSSFVKPRERFVVVERKLFQFSFRKSFQSCVCKPANRTWRVFENYYLKVCSYSFVRGKQDRLIKRVGHDRKVRWKCVNLTFFGCYKPTRGEGVDHGHPQKESTPASSLMFNLLWTSFYAHYLAVVQEIQFTKYALCSPWGLRLTCDFFFLELSHARCIIRVQLLHLIVVKW